MSAHLEPILDIYSPQGLNLIVSDQIMESYHSVINKFCDQFSPPSTSKDTQPWSLKEECWDKTMKRIVSRYNHACFQNDDFDDLPFNLQTNHELKIEQNEMHKVFEANLTSVSDASTSSWKLPSTVYG